MLLFNPIALSKAKIVYNFGLSECNRVHIWGKQCRLKSDAANVVSDQYLPCLPLILAFYWQISFYKKI